MKNKNQRDTPITKKFLAVLLLMRPGGLASFPIERADEARSKSADMIIWLRNPTEMERYLVKSSLGSGGEEMRAVDYPF